MNNSINLPPHPYFPQACPYLSTFRPKISYPLCNHSLEEIFSRSASASASASPDQMLIRACAFTHTHTQTHARACTRLVLHRRPSYESLDALSRRWISRGTLLQQVHRGAALQSAVGADSAARRCRAPDRVLRNAAESRRGICFALWQTRRQPSAVHFIRRDRCNGARDEFDFRKRRRDAIEERKR